MEVPFATDLTRIKNLVFSPCGVAGIAYAGVVQKLEEEDLLHDLEAVSGISSGSYAALMVALGYDSKTIKKLLISKDFKDFSRFSSKQLRKIIDGWTKHKLGLRRPLNGLLGGENLRIWAEALLVKRTGNPQMTFAEMKQYREMATLAAPTIEGYSTFMGKGKTRVNITEEAQEARNFFEKKVLHALQQKRKYIPKYKLGKNFRFDFEKAHGTRDLEYFEDAEVKEELTATLLERIKQRYLGSNEQKHSSETDVDAMVDELICIAMGFKKFYTLAAWISEEKEYKDFSQRYKAFPLDEEETPQVRLSQAIRLSSSFPIWFRNGVLYDRKDNKEKRFTDGGVAKIFHTSPFDKEGTNNNTLIVHTIKDETVDLKDPTSVKSMLQRRFEGEVVKYYNRKIDINFIARLISYYENKEERSRDPNNPDAHADISRLVVINRGNIEASDFGLSNDVQEILRNRGYEAMSECLERFKGEHPNLWREHKKRYPDSNSQSSGTPPPSSL